jgi:predicted ATPase/class 3 adenylate cyclase
VTSLPTGVITFLLTDVESSTRRWELEPDAMRQSMLEHDRLFENAVESNHGFVVKPRGEGDSGFSVFPRATEAVSAAVAFQRAIATTQWPTADPIRVRLALHTGEADLRSDDYYGSTVNRCARLRSIAWGGQSVMSLTTAQLVRETLPTGVELRDLGLHRLKDLSLPEHVFQIVISDISSDFPALQSLDRHLTNLPVQVTPFIGRERELKHIRDWLLNPTIRLITLTGPGGSGKTRLGVQSAASVVDEFADGVYLVSLESVSDPSLVLQTIAETLNVRESAGISLFESLNDQLNAKSILLVLDNFERLVRAGPQLSTLLAANPGLKLLVTSREALRIQGEHEFPVPVFGVPTADTSMSVDRLLEYESICLFVDRAREVKSDFALTQENAAAVVEICRRLDGLPLAIELAASRVRMLPPQALLKRLGRALSVLTGGARDLPERQQTLRATIAWSYDLLTDEEQTFFQLLAVFAGGFTLDAAIAVASESAIDDLGNDTDMTGLSDVHDSLDLWAPSIDVFNGIDALLSKSLVHQQGTPGQNGDDPRFMMLETIREFGLEQLEHGGQRRTAQERHARYFLMLAEMAEAELQGPQQSDWLGRLDADHRNLRAALRYALVSNDAETGLRMTGALWPFWEVRGYFTEGREWTERMLGLGGPPALRAKTLTGAGTMAWYQGDYERAAELHSEALDDYWKIGDVSGAAFATSNLGIQYVGLGDMDKAVDLFNKALHQYQVVSDEPGIADVYSNLAVVAFYNEEYARAAELFAQSLTIRRKAGDKQRIADALHNLGEVALMQQDYEQAIRYYRETLILRRELGASTGTALSFAALSFIEFEQGNLERSAELTGVADAMFEVTGSYLDPTERARYEETKQRLRSRLGDDVYMELRKEGLERSVDTAIAFALDQVQGSDEHEGDRKTSRLQFSDQF